MYIQPYTKNIVTNTLYIFDHRFQNPKRVIIIIVNGALIVNDSRVLVHRLTSMLYPIIILREEEKKSTVFKLPNAIPHTTGRRLCSFIRLSLYFICIIKIPGRM